MNMDAKILNKILVTQIQQCIKRTVFVVIQSLSCVWLFETPWTAACQDPLSLGFSKQEYWRRLACPPPEDLPNPGIEPRSPALQMDSLPSEPAGKPKDSGVSSLSLLQRIFQTQESNRGLLHFTRIFNQLNYQGSKLYIYIYPFFFGFPFHLGNHRALSIIPCAVQ